MKIKNFTTYLTEALDMEDLQNQVGDNYTELKMDILDMINNILEESTEIEDVKKEDLKDFFSNFISAGKNNTMIDELVEDNDIFNFYLKHQSDFDELLNEVGYMDKSPNDNNVFSLYDVIIDGTKEGVWNIIEILQSDLF